MKTTIVYVATLSLVLSANAQGLFEQLNLNTAYFEEVPPSSYEELMQEQKAKGEKFIRHFNIGGRLIPDNKNQRVYRLRETGEVININNSGNQELRDNWDKEVLGYIAMFAGSDHGLDGGEYVEHVNGANYRAVIFFRKHNVGITNYLLYNDEQTNTYLFIIYTSDLPDDVKIRNMKRLITSIKFDY